MEELNYRPNRIAQGLRLNKTYNIAFLISDITNDFYTEIYKGIHETALTKGYLTSLSEINDSSDSLEILLNSRPDGIILGNSVSNKTLNKFKKANIPLVSIAAAGMQQYTISTLVDNYLATQEAIDYLYKMGHRKIGFLSYNDRNRDRFKGYKDGLLKYELEYNEKFIGLFKENNYHYHLGYKTMLKLLKKNNRSASLTAIIANNDLNAIGAIKAAREHGLKVPDDISFISFDDSLAAQYCYPPLTTTKILKYKQGEAVAGLLFDLIAGKDVNSIKLPTEIIIRDSVKKIN